MIFSTDPRFSFTICSIPLDFLQGMVFKSIFLVTVGRCGGDDLCFGRSSLVMMRI